MCTNISGNNNFLISESIKVVQSRILCACHSSQREVTDIAVVAVSKTRSVKEIQQAMAEGIRLFGENKIQEAESKIPEIQGHAEWHFIGRIQSNKINRIFSLFDVIQSVDQIQILEKAQTFLLTQQQCKEVYLQVNTAAEPQKAGFRPEAVLEFFKSLAHKKYTQLKFRGMMCMGPHTKDVSRIKECFIQTKDLFDICQPFCEDLKFCSMGMSDDFEIAISAGSNMVRIGSAIFGPRSV